MSTELIKGVAPQVVAMRLCETLKMDICRTKTMGGSL